MKEHKAKELLSGFVLVKSLPGVMSNHVTFFSLCVEFRSSRGLCEFVDRENTEVQKMLKGETRV